MYVCMYGWMYVCMYTNTVLLFYVTIFLMSRVNASKLFRNPENPMTTVCPWWVCCCCKIEPVRSHGDNPWAAYAVGTNQGNPASMNVAGTIKPWRKPMKFPPKMGIFWLDGHIFIGICYDLLFFQKDAKTRWVIGACAWTTTTYPGALAPWFGPHRCTTMLRASTSAIQTLRIVRPCLNPMCNTFSGSAGLERREGKMTLKPLEYLPMFTPKFG